MDDVQRALHRPAEEEARRSAQWERAFIIGAALPAPPLAEFMTLETMLRRVIYDKGNDRIIVLPESDHAGHRALVLAPNAFTEAYRASGEMRGERWVPYVGQWQRAPTRIITEATALAIGRGRFIFDMEGRRAVNLWTQRHRQEPPLAQQALWRQKAGLFFEHIRFLIPDEQQCGRFLDWLAHCEQRPQVLPHHGYLMVTETFGVGRNWLAAVLARVWSGEVAMSLDLQALVTGNFNGRISGKRLAVVDEVWVEASRNGASRWAIEAKLRGIVTEETRTINPKYGREHTEFNVLRWLLFTNHWDALPMPKGDRRFDVISNPTVPRPEAYYAELYAALADPDFIAAVALELAQRDVRGFQPGARPPESEAKLRVIAATTPELEKDVVALMNDWQSSVAAASDVCDALGKELVADARRQFGHAMSKLSEQEPLRMMINKDRETVYLLRGRTAPDNVEAIRKAVKDYRAAQWFKDLVKF